MGSSQDSQPWVNFSVSVCLAFLGFFPFGRALGDSSSSSSLSMYLGSTTRDFKNPLAAPDKTAFLNPPLFFSEVGFWRLVGLGGMRGLGVRRPEGPGVAGSFFILKGVTVSFLIGVAVG